MSEDELHTLIAQLRAEIDELGPADDEARARLDALVTDLEERVAAPGEAQAGDHEDLMQGMREAVERFEVEHPRATGIINNIMVMLGSMGI